ncbi:MAG: hypothetical protein ACRDCE_06125 [Cetobacterium sp.]|uniref:hypothetical protein n=1 Tax=Cetobacterium sp. TaxID=2071632 RepID=UPI003EE51724
MKSHFIKIFNIHCDTFFIENSKTEIKGWPSSSKKAITFLESFIPKEDMVLINSKTGIKYHLIGNPDKIPTRTGEIIGYSIGFLSSKEYELKNISNSQNINIGNIHGSAIIGNQQNASINIGSTIEEVKSLIENKPIEDREELKKLVTLLEVIKENNISVSKGTFSKFADILNKYSDIALPIGSILLKWLSS